MKHATDGMDDSMIPIARPQVGDPKIENVVHVLRSGMLAGGRFDRAVLDPCNLCGGRFAWGEYGEWQRGHDLARICCQTQVRCPCPAGWYVEDV